MTLHALRSAGNEPAGLLTTIRESDEVVSHHHVPLRLIAAQAAAVGLPLRTVPLPEPCPNEIYEQRMRVALADPAASSVQAVAYGDLFLEDVRAYREERTREAGLVARFPLWGSDTARLAERFVAEGFRAVVCVVDTEQLDAAFLGRELDATFLEELPAGVDPAGEHGEFHSFVTDGPIFARPVEVELGVVRSDDRFARVELIASGG